MMKKIPLQFKEKYLMYCANHMMNVVHDGMFLLLADLRKVLKEGSYLPDDLVTIEVDPNTLLTLHAQLGERNENLTSSIHQRLKESLLPQLIALVSVDPSDPDTDLELLQSAALVVQTLQEKEANIDIWVESQIDLGRTRLLA